LHIADRGTPQRLPEPATGSDQSGARFGGTKELRLAVVCYGGSSLAIYMHGVTKEIQRLVKGSRLLEQEPGEDGSPSERVYRELLAELTETDAERLLTRVVVDVIAGTSAGGINGIYLAKGLAHNLSQDQLRDLWFERGDIKVLLRGPKRLPMPLRVAWVAARVLRRSPLRGDEMARWLYDALDEMDRRGPTPPQLRSLMPERHLLELFVTVTDFYGYDRQTAIADPNFVHDRRHRHALVFRYAGDGGDDFGGGGNAALAFAARTTSCFPGVFPPVSFAVFADYLQGREHDLEAFARRSFRLYELADARPADTFFVDGGVLDNKPFGLAIEAIRARPAGYQVDRRLLFLEPAPGSPPTASKHDAPGTISALLGAASGIPRREPILDDLLELAALNERVRRIRDIIEVSFEHIAGLVEQTLEKAGYASMAALPAEPDEKLIEWMGSVRDQAREEAGFSYATYIRMRISGVVDGLARGACGICDFPADSNQALLVRGTLRRWAEEAGLFEKSLEPTEQQLQFLHDFDLGYRRRRLRFVVDGLNGWYARVGEEGYPSRPDLDAGKVLLWAAIDRLTATIAGSTADAEQAERIRACFAAGEIARFSAESGMNPALYAGEHREELNTLVDELRQLIRDSLRGLDAQLYRDLHQLTLGATTGSAPWARERQRALLTRYLGFPYWDVLLYPIQALSDVGERDNVEVVRFSPEDAHLLHPPTEEPKVKGAAMHHFGAFFSREDRENDYLWGRLDGAERLIGILIGAGTPQARAWCERAFLAVLEEDEQALGHVRPLVGELRQQAGMLTGSG
jgi:patatin-related protein